MSPGLENEEIKIEPSPYHTPYRLHVRASSLAINDILGLNNPAKSAENPPSSVPSLRQNAPESDNDCMIVGTSEMPVPFGVTEDGLIKYKNDAVSANKPFLPTVGIENKLSL